MEWCFEHLNWKPNLYVVLTKGEKINLTSFDNCYAKKLLFSIVFFLFGRQTPLIVVYIINTTSIHAINDTSSNCENMHFKSYPLLLSIKTNGERKEFQMELINNES